MLSRPLTLDDSDTRGRGSVTVTPPHVLPLVGEGDAETTSGIYSSPWSSSPPLPLPSSFSVPVTRPPSFLSPPVSFTFSPVSPSLTCLAPPLPPHLISPSLLSSASSICSASPPPNVSSAPSISNSPPKAPCTPPAFSLSPPPSSSPPIPQSLHLSPPSSVSLPAPLFVSSTALPPPNESHPFSSAPLHHHSSLSRPPTVSSPPSPSSISAPHTSSMLFPSPSSVLIPPSVISPPPLVSPVPVAPPPCCPCSSLLTRLLSAHRLEVRRLLRGALASLGHRLDSLERRSRRRKKKKRGNGPRGGQGAYSPASATFTSFSSSCGPTPIPHVTSASSSSDSDTLALSLPSSFSQSEQKRGRSRSNSDEAMRGRKRRKKNRVEMNVPENKKDDDEEEEEDTGRFIGQMAVSFRGGGGEEEGEVPLTLQNFNQKKQRRVEGAAGQSEKTVSVVFRQNGYSSQDALLLLQSAQGVWTCSQSVPSVSCPEVLDVSSSQWHFSDFTPPFSLSSNHSAFRLCLCSSTAPFNPAPMLHLAVVAVETVSEFVRAGVCVSPLRPLKDWTAPSSLSSDHCYMRAQPPSSVFYTWKQQKQRANRSTQSVLLSRRRPLTLPSCSANELSGQFPASQSAASSKFLSTSGERSKRVSQIRIRRASPRETLLTPMGLPKVKRLKKKEFSLEEIYTNKNYKSPTTNRSLETIFEEPREKDGVLLLIGQQRRRRLLLFPDFTQPRKRKRPQGAGLPVAMVPRKRTAARRHCHGDSDDDADLDVMLVERLSALEDFLTRQGLDV